VNVATEQKKKVSVNVPLKNICQNIELPKGKGKPSFSKKISPPAKI
jgi:hypothetical protein